MLIQSMHTTFAPPTASVKFTRYSYANKPSAGDPASPLNVRVCRRPVPPLSGTFGFKVVGFWHAVAKSGEEAPATNVHWMIAWESEQQMNERWAAARASTAWQTIFRDVSDPLTGERTHHKVIRSTLLKPIPASPLQ